MDVSMFIPIAFAVGFTFVAMLGLIFKSFYNKVPQGTALIINDLSGSPRVSFSGGLVLPVIHQKETMKMSLVPIVIELRGKNGIISSDNIRADIAMTFCLKVRATQTDVLNAAKAVGADNASDNDVITPLFKAKFTQAISAVSANTAFLTMVDDRLTFSKKIIELVGDDLFGYVLEDAAIKYLDQTPLNDLDPKNIIDAENIRRINELTAA